ncbi:MAG TPA: prolyl oligopeptidase family serine peptidase, partial [Caulobacteraceae bacterium]|nr:prolyl oligopeptidase family serine peptidase [Caulobacteraceae bacterium]
RPGIAASGKPAAEALGSGLRSADEKAGQSMHLRLFASAILIAAAGSALAAQPVPPAPVFPKGDTVEVIQGVSVPDPYRALENADDPAVKAWSDAENVRTRGYLDALPGRQAVADKLSRMIKEASPKATGLQPRPTGVFAMYQDPARQQPWLILMNAAADPASRRDILNPNVSDPSGHTEIDWYVASPDGSKVAVSLSQNGSEDGTLHVYDVATGKELEAPIDRVQYPTAGGAVTWMSDSRGYWYTRYPDPSVPESERHFHQSLYLHRIGEPVSADKLVLSEKDGLPRTAEIYLDAGVGGKAGLASIEFGDGGQWLHFVLEPDGHAIQIGDYADRVIGGAVIDRDGTVYGVSRLEAPMGKVVKLRAPYAGGFAKAPVIVPERQDAAIIDGGEFSQPLAIVGDRLFVSRIVGGPSEVSISDLDGGHASTLPLPAIAAVDEIDALPDGGAMFDVATYLEPPYFMRWSRQTGDSVRTALKMTSPISFADAEVHRIFATSKDGTKVPINVIARKGIKLDGGHPVLVWGYGGYGVNEVPVFGGSNVRLWLDAGGVYAVANIRGGGEYGQRWHEEGMLTKKQNGFDDFAAAAQAMIDDGYTTHARLALRGGSNGGLLMGAMITQHPDLARAVVSQVGIYDMLRVELDPNGAFNTTEFGTVKDPDQFKALYAYSPYHNVHPGTAYPAVLMMTGANDGRVNPMQSRKFAAALQAATSSDRPILLRTSQTGGHGIGASLDQRIREATDWNMFLFDQLGMDAVAAGK